MTDTDRIEVAGHEVYPEQKSVLPCPPCGESREVFYLGSRSSLTAGDQPRSFTVSGWVCPECSSTLEVTDEKMMNGTYPLSWSDVTVRDESEESDT